MLVACGKGSRLDLKPTLALWLTSSSSLLEPEPKPTATVPPQIVQVEVMSYTVQNLLGTFWTNINSQAGQRNLDFVLIIGQFVCDLLS